MKRDALIQWLHEGRTLAGSRSPSSQKLCAWVGIYPIDPGSVEGHKFLSRHGVASTPPGERVYNVRLFEVEIEKLDSWIYDGDLKNLSDHVTVGDASLFDYLHSVGVDEATLENPRLTDYPL